MNYWIFKHKPGSRATENDCVEYIEMALRNNCCLMQYEDGIQGSIAKTMWNQTMKVREGDVIFLYGGRRLYAYGYAVKPRHTDGYLTFTEAMKYDKTRVGSVSWVVFDSDADNPENTASVFYQNLKDDYGSWGERIDVDSWKGVLIEGKEVSLSDDVLGGSRFWPVRNLTAEAGEKLMGQLIEEYLERNPLVSFLENSKNIVLTGAPGTGKTYSARNIAANLTAGKDWIFLDDDERRRIDFVQFHQSYDYTDFVEGLRPVSGESSVGFVLERGIFKSFCAEALEDSDEKYVFIIDEINRGEVSKIFGELLFSLDPDYRGETGRVKTQYQNMIMDTDDPFYAGFYVPENVYIIGTMNDIDRSVDSLDFAFRRRFNWVEINAEKSKAMFSSPKAWKYKNGNLSGVPGNIEEIKARMDRLNSEIIKPEYGLGREYQIGAAYFLKYTTYLFDDSTDSSDKAFDSLWKYNLEPLLREYLRGTGKDIEKLRRVYYNTTTAPADDIE